ncbi:hypothetical protein CEXT_357341 [Caerostris extrusa]|uniref:Uncharacterized protein n=1 Tax=Caerostris extrusa TaxID=172846 RepID=A0AAV4NIX6_CAEEX|nr:hypothetical protein CEXT_357341 [Caerostris extrusa]
MQKRHRTYTTQSRREINCIASACRTGVFEQSGLAPRTERHGSSLLHPHLRSPKRYIYIPSCRYACEKIANAAPSPSTGKQHSVGVRTPRVRSVARPTPSGPTGDVPWRALVFFLY